MKCKRGLVTVLVGLAMLATPITAAARDYRDYPGHNDSRSSGAAHHDWHENHPGWHRGWGTVDEYRNYGRNYGTGYYGAPAYAAPAYPVGVPYGGYGGGRNCANARRVMNTYNRDRNTGHPAAAYDLLAQNRWAFNSGCGAGPAYGGGGLLGGWGGYGAAPAWGNNGRYNAGYGQPYGNGQPYGYGQPYGGSSFLGPLLQQFVH